ncbi:MAG: BREX-2 system phosphatase PglZ [Vicinamibacteraceae bacterium]
MLDHRLVRFQEARGRRLEMARRLVRWLHRPSSSEPTSLLEAVQAYCREGAFVDLARLALLGGEQPPELGRAYSELLTRARDRRERENERFARLLAAAGGAPAPDQLAIVPVERVLEDVVAPVAGGQPVLFLVMDGLSRPIYHELLDAIAEQGWRLWKPARPDLERAEWAALAAIPTITQVSRTSLFCGSLTAGAASHEKRGFAAHAALQQPSRSRWPPVLFHKGELVEPSGRALSAEVRQALTTPEQRIVGVVLNVVDDLLFKAEQLQPRWTLDAAPLLGELFNLAHIAGRTIILTSDHGHLLDDDSAFQGREAGERWREDAGAPAQSEVRMMGRRVLAKERSSVIVPWSERTRYGARKNGYHGGVTPQEAILPLAVLTSSESGPAGFVEAPLTHPDWWFESVDEPRVRHVAQPEPVSRPRKEKDRPLFDLLDPARGAPAPIAAAVQVSWIDALFRSERYAEQRGLSSGRGLPPDEEVRRLLFALSERGWTLTKEALAQRLGLPSYRLHGLIVATRRLLNVDGVQVLDVDEPSSTVKLHRPLLEQQFELHES